MFLYRPHCCYLHAACIPGTRVSHRLFGRYGLLLVLVVWVLPLVLPASTLGEEGIDNRYLVRSPRPLSTTAGLVVHDRQGSTYLVSGSPTEVERLARDGCKLVRLPIEMATRQSLENLWQGIGARQSRPRTWREGTEADPAIQALVAQVTWDGIADKIAWLGSYETRYSYSPQCFAAADGICGFFIGQGLSAILQPFTSGGTSMYNVIATQTGTVYPDSIFVIGAHYDSVSEDPMHSAPGADDNASGVAAVMTAAEILTQHSFRYTIRYICFGGEEQGLLGSEYYAHQAAFHGVAIVGMLNFDMLGWWEEDVDFDLEIETNVASQWLAAAIVNTADLYTGMPYQLHVNNNAWWGDHFAFWLNGYAAVNHEESYDWDDADFNPYYHSTQDVLAHIHPDFTTGNVKIAVAAMATLAQLAESSVPVSESPPPAGFSLAASPNPFNGRVSFSLTAPPDVADVQLAIHDARGWLIDTLEVPVRDGRAEAHWEARDRRQAHATGSGVYFCRLLGADGLKPVKVVYVK